MRILRMTIVPLLALVGLSPLLAGCSHDHHDRDDRRAYPAGYRYDHDRDDWHRDRDWDRGRDWDHRDWDHRDWDHNRWDR